ncbi:MAG: class I SAM-dependent methyltransferase [Candidatus Hodarchaeales archaeon]
MSTKHGPDWAFKMMAIFHDSPLRRAFSKPEDTLRAAGLEPGMHVLEIGCGPGFFTIPASRIVSEKGFVYALDIHPLAAEKVQEKLDNFNITNVKTIIASATNTGLPDESMDLAFIFGVPRILKNEKFLIQVLTELHRVLRSKGTVSIDSTKKKLVTVLENNGFRYKETRKRMMLFTKK